MGAVHRFLQHSILCSNLDSTDQIAIDLKNALAIAPAAGCHFRSYRSGIWSRAHEDTRQFVSVCPALQHTRDAWLPLLMDPLDSSCDIMSRSFGEIDPPLS